MKYLSIDLEATGLAQDDLIIEFGMIPFCTETGVREDLARALAPALRATSSIRVAAKPRSRKSSRAARMT